MISLFGPSRCLSLVQSNELYPLTNELAESQKIEESYRRARAVAPLTRDDVLHLSEKFWEMHSDQFVAVDGAALTLLTIQYNLVAGAIAPLTTYRRDLQELLRQILSFEVSAQFLLTEVGRGLDALNLETTATLLADGTFDLHTPSETAAKHMPPTTPLGGIPKIALVYARLIVEGESYGVKPFIVSLTDGEELCAGISVRLIPRRAGSKAVDHALTSFSHVQLPATALLGSLQKPRSERVAFQRSISRVSVGTLALAMTAIPMISVSSVIAARYSLRRTVTDTNGQQVPIWTFRTQHLPVLHAIAKAYVMKAHALDAIQIFKDFDLDERVRMGVAAAYKAATIPHCQSSLVALSERLGAHGLFEHNMIIASHLELRGVSIAEGDILALSIRLASELMLDRYKLPSPRHPTCLLAQHEVGLMKEFKQILSSIGKHRSNAFNHLLLPLCQPLVEAIGHRMAYEAALDAGVDEHLLKLYEIGVMGLDPAWYSENVAIGRRKLHEMEESVTTTVLPSLERHLQGLHAEPFALAPVVSQERYRMFVQELPLFEGHGPQQVFAPTRSPAPRRSFESDRRLARL